MEIITILLSGISRREVRIMSAGRGVEHLEINGSANKSLSLFQIWITPDRRDVAPRYGQKAFDPAERKNKLGVLMMSMNDQANPPKCQIITT